MFYHPVTVFTYFRPDLDTTTLWLRGPCAAPHEGEAQVVCWASLRQAIVSKSDSPPDCLIVLLFRHPSIHLIFAFFTASSPVYQSLSGRNPFLISGLVIPVYSFTARTCFPHILGCVCCLYGRRMKSLLVRLFKNLTVWDEGGYLWVGIAIIAIAWEVIVLRVSEISIKEEPKVGFYL